MTPLAITHCDSRLRIQVVTPSLFRHCLLIQAWHLLLEPSHPLVASGLTTYLTNRPSMERTRGLLRS